jgi:uncharacterized repeat protein (TIGR01451 family)
LKHHQSNIYRKMLFCLILFFLGLMSVSVTHAENYTFVTKWYGNSYGQFSGPWGVAVDFSDNVYVSDSYNKRILKFSSNGNPITQWSSWSSGEGQFKFPYGIAVDSSGNVYVADRGNNSILKFNSNCEYLAQWGSSGSGDGQFNEPFGIAVDSVGNVYVADFYNHRIQKFDSSGTFLTKWGSFGIGNGQFNHPEGIAVDSSGKVYVADRSNNRIQKFDSSGTFLAKWDSWGSGDGQFNQPKGIAVDSSGNVYVADMYNHRIQKFNSSGGYLTKWGSYGSGDGQFNEPSGVAVNSMGNVYVADYKNNRIQMFTTSFLVQEDTNLFLSLGAPESKTHESSMTYTLHYFNFGNISAHNVVLEDILPDEVTFESASEGGVYDPSTRTVRWNIGSVNSTGHGYRTLSVNILQEITAGNVIVNNANISTSDLEVQYDDNKAQAQTRVTGLNLPPNVSIEPNNGGIGTPSVTRNGPITFSYHCNQPVMAIGINIQIDDGGPDIVGNMIPATSNIMAATADSTTEDKSDWTYTITFYPRHGLATVTYNIQPTAPYSTGYDVRGSVGGVITADDIESYIENYYPTSPMLDETNIGSSFINAGGAYGMDPAFLVAMAELEGRFGTAGWAASYPEAHNTFGYGIPSEGTPVNSINSADSWGAMVNRVANSIANGPYYFNADLFTVEQIREKYAGSPNSQGIADMMNKLYIFSLKRHPLSFLIYIDPAGYIYDVDTGARIAGASVWLQHPDGKGDWENVTTGQNLPVSQPDINPLTTDQNGMYQWDVLEGSYRVHVEAAGYEAADSIVVSIPPPVTDLHVGLHHINDPNVSPILPVANFSADVSSGYAPLSVQFTDLSKNATGWTWDFGDGINSTDRYPIHIYSATGIYTVNLTAINGNGADSRLATINVFAQPAIIVFPGYTNPPTDQDQDGLYEDINGNGRLDFDDVVTYYDNMDWIEEYVPLEFFDYNKNGGIDFDDVVKLYDML